MSSLYTLTRRYLFLFVTGHAKDITSTKTLRTKKKELLSSGVEISRQRRRIYSIRFLFLDETLYIAHTRLVCCLIGCYIYISLRFQSRLNVDACLEIDFHVSSLVQDYLIRKKLVSCYTTLFFLFLISSNQTF